MKKGNGSHNKTCSLALVTWIMQMHLTIHNYTDTVTDNSFLYLHKLDLDKEGMHNVLGKNWYFFPENGLNDKMKFYKQA